MQVISVKQLTATIICSKPTIINIMLATHIEVAE